MTIVFIAASFTPSGVALAFDGPAIEARGALGVSNMLSSAQRDRGYKTGFVPDLRPALRLGDTVAAELVLASWFFPNNNGGSGRATLLGAGARFDPRVTSWLTWFVDAHGGLAMTGANNRFMLDGGTGVDVWLMRNVAVGPFVRYGQVLDSGPDPRFWAIGVGATMTLESGRDEPPALGGNDPERDERQREWERNRQRQRQSPRERDRDGDGIVDAQDICPDEKPGPRPDPNMQGCPLPVNKQADAAPAAGDRDGDGVPDRDDKCPGTPFGANPDPMAMGCPLADRDHDGVPDLYDACPNKAGSPDSNSKKNGCPGAGIIASGGGDSSQLAKPIYFHGNSESVSPSSIPALQALADLLKSRPGTKVSVEGHTDSSLSALQSLELSEKRAENVKQWLVSNGVEADRLIVRGHGDTRPIASNKTAKGRQANARVELVIIGGSSGSSISP
ncbi:MAG TPA: OmpA family protein [Polyangia bacterium]|nr:OmpA family protein [Polyangia bacterium]